MKGFFWVCRRQGKRGIKEQVIRPENHRGLGHRQRRRPQRHLMWQIRSERGVQNATSRMKAGKTIGNLSDQSHCCKTNLLTIPSFSFAASCTQNSSLWFTHVYTVFKGLCSELEHSILSCDALTSRKQSEAAPKLKSRTSSSSGKRLPKGAAAPAQITSLQISHDYGKFNPFSNQKVSTVVARSSPWHFSC